MNFNNFIALLNIQILTSIRPYGVIGKFQKNPDTYWIRDFYPSPKFKIFAFLTLFYHINSLKITLQIIPSSVAQFKAQYLDGLFDVTS